MPGQKRYFVYIYQGATIPITLTMPSFLNLNVLFIGKGSACVCVGGGGCSSGSLHPTQRNRYRRTSTLSYTQKHQIGPLDARIVHRSRLDFLLVATKLLCSATASKRDNGHKMKQRGENVSTLDLDCYCCRSTCNTSNIPRAARELAARYLSPGEIILALGTPTEGYVPKTYVRVRPERVRSEGVRSDCTAAKRMPYRRIVGLCEQQQECSTHNITAAARKAGTPTTQMTQNNIPPSVRPNHQLTNHKRRLQQARTTTLFVTSNT